MRAGRVVASARLVQLLRRHDVLARQPLVALEGLPRVLQIGRRFRHLRLGGRERGFGLADLFGRLLLLVAQRSFRFLHLRRHAGRGVGVVGGVGADLVGHDDGQQLIACDRVALVNEDLADLAGDLGTDHHVVGRNDAGEHHRSGAGVHHVVRHRGESEREHEDETNSLSGH